MKEKVNDKMATTMTMIEKWHLAIHIQFALSTVQCPWRSGLWFFCRNDEEIHFQAGYAGYAGMLSSAEVGPGVITVVDYGAIRGHTTYTYTVCVYHMYNRFRYRWSH